MQDDRSEIEAFERLQPNLRRTWSDIREERLMFALNRLRNPNARVICRASQPVHAEIVDHYLRMLEGAPVNHARQRLSMMSVYDASSRPA